MSFFLYPLRLLTQTFDHPTLQVNLDDTVSNHFALISIYFKGNKVDVDQIDQVLKTIGVELTPKERWELMKTLPITCEHS